MADRPMMGVGIFTGLLALSGCLFSQEGKLLPAPADARPTAAKHNAEGIAAYNQGQMALAKQHFEAAVQANLTLAEAHYNLGMVLYKMGAEAEATPHFMEAANLAPGNEVIWSSPPLSGVHRGTKSLSSGGGSDGHGHSH